jgi:uncharacterized protein YndB with AHSA1/START domain
MGMAERQTPIQTVNRQEVLITRVLDAPRELVFGAWTDPEQLAQWFGPEGFRTPRETVEVDLRVGGHLHLTMVQEASGTEFPLRYEILELIVPELIVLRSGPMPEMGLPEPTFTRVELHDLGGRTRMTLTDGPYPQSGPAEAGWTAAFDKLDALLVSG